MISAKIVYIRSMTLWNDEIKMVLVVRENMNLASDGLKLKLKLQNEYVKNGYIKVK